MQLDGLTCFKILRSLGESDTSLVKQIEHLKKITQDYSNVKKLIDENEQVKKLANEKDQQIAILQESFVKNQN